MDRRNLQDLLVLQAVAEGGSFTRAAAALGRAQSGISQSIRSLEKRLGTPLLNRTTRSVSLTDAGERLLRRTAPAFREISEGLSDAASASDSVSGVLRLTMADFPARKIVGPTLKRFMTLYPRISLDIHVGDRFDDIVEKGYDAGIRLGTHLENDMIAVPVGPEMRAVVVASPAYLSDHPTPRTIEDLREHDCINYRTASHGDNFRWRFRQGSRSIDVPVTGRLMVNDAPLLVETALSGVGLAYTFEPFVVEELASGRLVRCLADVCPVWPGYHLYYPGRDQKSKALSAFVDHLRTKA